MKNKNIQSLLRFQVNFKFIAAILFANALMVSSCGNNTETEEVIEEITLASSIADIPSSVSSYTSGTGVSGRLLSMRGAVTGSGCIGGHCGVYDGVRGYVAMGDGAADLVRSIVTVMKDAIKAPAGTYPINTAPSTEPTTIGIDVNTSVGYDHVVDVYYNTDNTGDVQGARISYSEDTDGIAKGKVQLTDKFLQSAANMMIEITFDGGYGGVTTRSLDIAITGIDNSVDLSAPTTIVLNYTENGDIFDLKGASYHPAITDLSITDHVYNFRAQGSKSQNLAVLDLALAPATETDISIMFTTHSVSAFFTDFSYTMLQTEIQNQFDAYLLLTEPEKTALGLPTGITTLGEYTELLETYVCNAVATYCTVDGSGEWTIGEFTAFIDNYVDDTTSTGDDWIVGIQQLRGIVNSAYFNSGGFVQTWDGSFGVDSSGVPVTGPPSGYTGLDASLVTPYVPEAVSLTTLNFGF
ncbi:MAG: hypothetical protein OEZ13_08545 [Spirochaetia bacterium]|nr:hypothetical protein [Spirochaetia bacterium]